MPGRTYAIQTYHEAGPRVQLMAKPTPTQSSQRVPRAARLPYTEEQKFFIMYQRIIRELSWPSTRENVRTSAIFCAWSRFESWLLLLDVAWRALDAHARLTLNELVRMSLAGQPLPEAFLALETLEAGTGTA